MRSAAWGSYRSAVRVAKAKERDVRKARERELRQARASCEAKKRAVKQDCASTRKKIRADARRELAKLRKRRLEAREAYSWKWGRGGHASSLKRGQRRYTRSESDSLAAHNIPDRLLPIWDDMRRQFSYDLQPDHRAEKFLEWVQEHDAEVEAELAALYSPTDRELAKAYAEHYQEEQQMEAVPF